MAPINSTSGFGADNNWLILQAGDGKYRLVTDDDGPGGKPPVTSDELSEDELNAKLEAMNNGQGVGFKLVDGVYVPVDGYTGPLGSSAPSPVYSGGHDLPPLTGPVASNTDTSGHVTWLASNDGSQDAALLWLGFMVMAESSMRDVSDARTGRTLAQGQKTAFSLREIKATEEKIEKEKEAADSALTTAWISFAIATVAGGVGGYASAASSGAGATAKWTAGAWGLASGASGQAATLFTAWRTAADASDSGPKGQANKKELEAKFFAAMAAMVDEAIEDTKSNYDAAKENFKAALKIISDHYDQQAQVTAKIFQA
jgi:hypothetical protein